MKPKRWTLIGIMLTSMAILNLEIALTRVFSVFMWYHFAFLTISLALLGSAAGGVWLHLLANRFPRERVAERLSMLATCFSLASAGAFVVYLQIPFGVQTMRLSLSWQVAGWLTLINLVLSLPFLLGGATLALAIGRFSESVGQVYFYDLTGASLGCLASVAALNGLGGTNAVLLTGVLAALAAVLFSLQACTRGWRTLATLAAILLSALLASNLGGIPGVRGAWLQVRRRAGYEATHEIIYEKWNALSRVTVYEDPGWLQPFGWGLSPTYVGPDPGHLMMLIDSRAGTPIQKWTAGDWAAIDFIKYDLTSIAYHLLPEANVFVIGPGGGRDILTGLLFGAHKVTGIELNPTIVHAARNEFGEYAGRVYDHPDVRVEIEDARTYLARSREHFDLIQASLIDTWAASSAGAFALSENSLYTREAFLTYYERLTERGMVSFSRWYLAEDPAETLRLVALGLDSWQQAGSENPATHIVLIANLARNRSATEGLATMLLKKAPFTEAEVARLAEISQEMEFTVLYAPGLAQDMNPVSKLIAAPDVHRAIADYALDISPPTDERPFFFNFVRPGIALSAVYRGSPVYRASAEANDVLLILLGISTVLTLLFVLIPMGVRAGNPLAVAKSWSYLAYFASLGIGFMLVEIPLIQRLTVYLGSPSYALVIVLFTILLSSGLGSLSTRHNADPRPPVSARKAVSRLRWILPGLIVALALHYALLPSVLRWTQHWAFVGRVAVCLAAISPAGFLMGQPFPLGIEWAGSQAPSNRRLAMLSWLWAVNGAASVVGSALATVIALHTGFRAVSLAGIGSYGIALVLATITWAPKKMNRTEMSEHTG